MTDKIIGLNEHRADKEQNNKLWTPADCIKAFQRDMDDGTIKPTRVLIIYEEDIPGSKDTAIAAYRANVDRDTEVTLLWLMLNLVTDKFIRAIR